MADARLRIIIDALNTASAELNGLQKDLAGVEKAGGKANKSLADIGKSMQDIGKPIRNAGAALTAGVTVPLGALIIKSTMAAAEVDTLDLVVKQLGKTAGYSEDEIMGHVESVRKMGIEAAASREIIAKFVTAKLDAADAAGLARIAQDQAVISGENSTDTMNRLTDALITGNAQMFRSMKMNVDLGASYEAMAESLGKNVDQLTETERVQARVNAVTEYGATIQGTYEAAMGDSYKQMGSFKRYLDDIFVALGEYFTPALNDAVFAIGDLLKTIPELISEGGALEPVLEGWGDAAGTAANMIAGLTTKMKELDPATAKTIGDVVGLTAVLGPLLLVGGQAVIWAGKLAGALGTTAGALGGVGVAAFAAAAGIIYLNNVTEQGRKDLIEYGNNVIFTASSYEEYLGSVLDATDATNKWWHGTQVWIDGNGNLVDSLGRVKEENFALTESEWEMIRANREWGVSMAVSKAAMEEYANKTKDATEVTDDATEATDEHERALARAAVRAIEYGGASDIAREALEKLGVEAEEQKRLLDDLADATENKTAADLLLEEVNLRLTELWADNALTAESYNAALEAAHQIALDYPEALSTLLQLFGEWGDQVQNISDLLHGIPSEIKVDIIQTWYEAQGGTWTAPGGHYVDETRATRPTGGPVQAGNPYLWQEYGYRGEVMVPSQNGFVLSRADAKRILAEAANGKGGNTYNYNLTMPTSSDPTDVGMAFELLEAYGGN